MIKPKSCGDWPSRGPSCVTPVWCKQACTGNRGVGRAQHAIQHTKPQLAQGTADHEQSGRQQEYILHGLPLAALQHWMASVLALQVLQQSRGCLQLALAKFASWEGQQHCHCSARPHIAEAADHETTMKMKDVQFNSSHLCSCIWAAVEEKRHQCTHHGIGPTSETGCAG